MQWPRINDLPLILCALMSMATSSIIVHPFHNFSFASFTHCPVIESVQQEMAKSKRKRIKGGGAFLLCGDDLTWRGGSSCLAPYPHYMRGPLYFLWVSQLSLAWSGTSAPPPPHLGLHEINAIINTKCSYPPSKTMVVIPSPPRTSKEQNDLHLPSVPFIIAHRITYRPTRMFSAPYFCS